MTVNKKKTVKLNEAEQRLAVFLAKRITSNNRNKGAKNTPYAGRSQLDIDTDGFGAEIAFCKLFNYYPDLSIAVRVGSPDVVTRGKKTIDVKNTEVLHPQLFVKKSKMGQSKATDFYAFMVGKFPTYNYIGFVTHAQVLKCEDKTFYGNESTVKAIPVDLIQSNYDRSFDVF